MVVYLGLGGEVDSNISFVVFVDAFELSDVFDHYLVEILVELSYLAFELVGLTVHLGELFGDLEVQDVTVA